MDKVLVSPGFGAGWSTWHWGPREQTDFMLTYEPFIEAIEGADTAGLEVVKVEMPKSWSDPDNGSYGEVGMLSCLASLLEQFAQAWRQRFNCECPCPLGLQQLRVYRPAGRKFRVTEYNGSEGIEFRDDIEWR